MLSSNWSRELDESLLLAPAVALAEASLRRVATLSEAGELALWKTVIMSRVLCCEL